MRVNGALEGLPGVFGIDVDVEGGLVTVRYDPHRADPAQFAPQLRALGYEPGEPHFASCTAPEPTCPTPPSDSP
ncbi:MAG: heavy-metal-associated domain-containing protein [Planctomycetota bacterium]